MGKAAPTTKLMGDEPGVDYTDLEAGNEVPVADPVRVDVSQLLKAASSEPIEPEPGCGTYTCVSVCGVPLFAGLSSASVVIGRAILEGSLSFPSSHKMALVSFVGSAVVGSVIAPCIMCCSTTVYKSSNLASNVITAAAYCAAGAAVGCGIFGVSARPAAAAAAVGGAILAAGSSLVCCPGASKG